MIKLSTRIKLAWQVITDPDLATFTDCTVLAGAEKGCEELYYFPFTIIRRTGVWAAHIEDFDSVKEKYKRFKQKQLNSNDH